jgi:hypothetical protein
MLWQAASTLASSTRSFAHLILLQHTTLVHKTSLEPVLFHPGQFSFLICNQFPHFVPLNTIFQLPVFFIFVAANSGVSASDVTVGTPNCTASNWNDLERTARGTVSCTTHKSVVLFLQLAGCKALSAAKDPTAR